MNTINDFVSKLRTPAILSIASVAVCYPIFLAAQQQGAGQLEPAVSPAPTSSGWPKPVQAPQNAPNVVLILVDDAGFSATATFGGAIHTPNLDKLAAHGLRYNQFGVNPICSPTRASLLSGLNNHEIGFGSVTEKAGPYPGYNTVWPKSATCVAETLKDNGYSTAAFGKWHNTPEWEAGPTGPFDRWPTGLGFQHFYGFLAGWDNQYYPSLYRDTVPVQPPSTPAQGYNLTADMTGEAIRWLHEEDAVDSSKPFFLYYATGATHWPNQVPKEWVEKYKGKFDEGWDKLRAQTFERQKRLGVIPASAELTPRPPGLPAWESLSPDQKKLLARQAEVYAGYAEQVDFEIGRLLKAIDDEGKTGNTLVIEIFGDNGGSAEGGLYGTDAWTAEGSRKSISERLEKEDELGTEMFINYYAAAWAWAQSSPFQGTKVDASHLGGTRDPLIISWPNRIHVPGGLRTQFQHVTDIVPTIYEAAGIIAPKMLNGVAQLPLEGASLMYTFDHPNAPSNHPLQYFAADGNRGIYMGGWWAGRLYRNTWDPPLADNQAASSGKQDLDRHPWELYNLNEDYSQAHNLADKYPDKLAQLVQVFDKEAVRNQVYPLLHPQGLEPSPSDGRDVFVYRSGVDRITNQVAPDISGQTHTITADVEVSTLPAQGVVIAQGGRYGGFTLFVKDGYVIFEVNAFGNRAGQLISRDRLLKGTSRIVVGVDLDLTKGTPRARPGRASLQINGVSEGEQAFSNAIGKQHGESLDIGSDLLSSVSPDYISPNKFNGRIDQVRIELKKRAAVKLPE